MILKTVFPEYLLSKGKREGAEMVRIHVFRASHLIAGFLAFAAAAVLIFLIASGAFSEKKDDSRENRYDYRHMEAEAMSVSASALFSKGKAGEIEIEVIRSEKQKPRVLIYHTHTHEAYDKQSDDTYIETSAWRTADNRHNIVRVGEMLSEYLSEKGFIVVHDTTDHELTELSSAYTRSLDTLLKYEGQFDILIDLHRDAYAEKTSGNPFSIKIGDTDSARLMFLVGNGVGFSDEMFYKENYELATVLTGRLNELVPGICRPVMVKDGRYNQHLQEGSMLIEVGHNKNTIEQALAAMPYLAEAMYDVFME